MAMYVVDGKEIKLDEVLRKLRSMGHTVSYSHLSKVFTGEKTPSYSLFKALARALDVNLDDLERILASTAIMAEKALPEGKKWAVLFDFDLICGIAYMARLEEGEGAVALFETKKEAQEWISSGQGPEEKEWDINYVIVTAVK
jgi:transcriptional regulator with XRE-family HTH domain